MVAGDILELPLELDVAMLAEADAPPERSNGFVGSWLRPVEGGEDDFDVSDFRTSSADDAAPRASSMAELQRSPHRAAGNSRRLFSKPRAIAKNPTK
jgi:hypothetical protein